LKKAQENAAAKAKEAEIQAEIAKLEAIKAKKLEEQAKTEKKTIPPIQVKVDELNENRTKDDIKKMKKDQEQKQKEAQDIQARIDAANAKIAALKAKNA